MHLGTYRGQLAHLTLNLSGERMAFGLESKITLFGKRRLSPAHLDAHPRAGMIRQQSLSVRSALTSCQPEHITAASAIAMEAGTFSRRLMLPSRLATRPHHPLSPSEGVTPKSLACLWFLCSSVALALAALTLWQAVLISRGETGISTRHISK
ncbi:unnamed protein product [Rangifer tarandus platyrhynchus]|uniref:Uncharacterized protein n=2 Tax=Rangifer tarandus platyrhynchus TaxID=3082113 RepID=A0AC59ZFV1_RANTA|nr:unnamed protein product [Rangifer tarandus platyrhynchus]